jgi:ABC-type nitrate/sulfonate/bicarbonate transport system substrate-binding protein
MSKFIIQPHGRLQEWIAHEKGYFRDEGLDYEFLAGPSADSSKRLDEAGRAVEIRAGAFESYQAGGGNKGTRSDISCACHWTVNEAAAEGIGLLWEDSYVVTPGGIMVPPDSPIRDPEDLAGQEIAVGYHSGSHFTALQALESFLPPDRIRLKFVGSSWARVDIALSRELPAVSAWGITYLTLEQLGFRKVLDTTFMIAFLFPEGAARADVAKYMNALRRAQGDLDLEPEKYKHFYAREIPERYRTRVDVRRFSPGERIVFLPYTREINAKTQEWLKARQLFEVNEGGSRE